MGLGPHIPLAGHEVTPDSKISVSQQGAGLAVSSAPVLDEPSSLVVFSDPVLAAEPGLATTRSKPAASVAKVRGSRRVGERQLTACATPKGTGARGGGEPAMSPTVPRDKKLRCVGDSRRKGQVCPRVGDVPGAP